MEIWTIRHIQVEKMRRRQGLSIEKEMRDIHGCHATYEIAAAVRLEWCVGRL